MPIVVGGTEYLIPPVKGWKAARAVKLIGRLGDRLPKLMDEMNVYQREFSEKHYREITRDEALSIAADSQAARELRIAELRSEDPEGHKEFIEALEVSHSWAERLTDKGGVLGPEGKDSIRMPDRPGNETVALVMVGKVADIAEAELIELLGLMVTDNEEAWRKKQQGGLEQVDRLIVENGEKLMWEGDLEEIAEFALQSVDALTSQLQRRRDHLGKLASRVRKWLPFDLGEKETDPATSPTPPPSSEPSETKPKESPSTSDSSSSSSTSSPPPTDGTNGEPSTPDPTTPTSATLPS